MKRTAVDLSYLALAATLILAACSTGRPYQPQDGGGGDAENSGGGGSAGKGTGGGAGKGTGGGGSGGGGSGGGGHAGSGGAAGATGGAGGHAGVGGVAGTGGLPGVGGAAGACGASQHACGGICVSNGDVATCGSSCTACVTPTNGTAICDGTNCGFTCNSGTHNCNGSCVSNSAVATCGTSCSACATPTNGTATCDGTGCGVTCNGGTHSCNGVCVSNSAVATCGTSCSACATPTNGTATCDGTSCGVNCNSGLHNCAGVCVSNSAVATCGTSCSACTAPTNGTATCDGSSCGGTCPSGQQLCVGACIAAAQACSGVCPSGTHNCSGTCQTNTSVNDCGSACTPCAPPANATATCDGTNCGFACSSGYHVCGSTCAANNSIASCGSSSCTACTPPANATATCDGTSCGFSCNGGYHLCGSTCAANNSIASCGSSSCTACTPPANATATCDATSCGFTCGSGYHACGGSCAANSSTATCGSSCSACTVPANATATCDGTSCGFTCNSGYHACGNSCASNGSPATCGSSCTACTAPTGGTATCDGTNCGFTCGSSAPKKCAASNLCIASTGCCSTSECPTMAGGQVGTCDPGTNSCNYSCPTNTQSCTVGTTTTCIATGSCCKDSDCSGTCKTCNQTNHSCVAATNEDDPNGRCAGTCDSAGACKSKPGQLCNTVPGLCISGTTCSPDGYCCNTACTGACVACDLPGFQGTCTNLAPNTAPHGNHPSCGGTGNCAGACGSGGTCSFPTATCGSGPTCSGINIIGQSSCSAGSCVAPAAQPCLNDFICSANACKTTCSADADCASGFCQGGTCHLAAISISAGFFHTCVVLSDGSARCWGDNYVGELGIGTVTQTGIDGSATPVAVTGLPAKALSITSGSQFNCARLSDGSVWCWGDNHYGQLGNTSAGTLSVPTPVKAALSGSPSAISAGEFHVCSLVSGAVWCWGGENFGQLGNGQVLGNMSPNWTATPVKVAGLGTVSAIACGAAHSCAISGGVASCWGDDNYGQLGNNAVGNNPQGLAGWPVPQAVDFSGTAVAMTGGNEHTCMLDSGANVYCWGENDEGEVGDNVNNGANALFPMYVSNNISAPTAVAAGGDHSCAINIGGSVVCWGYPLNGQLGDAATTIQYLPEPVVGLNSPAVALALGGEHTCVIVKNGSVWCWGDNDGGQLGNGTVTGGATPVQVSGW